MNYSKYLTKWDSVKIFAKAINHAVDIAEPGYEILPKLVSDNEKIQRSLPSDLDRILMEDCDHFPPSKRLDNKAKRYEKICNRIPKGFRNSFSFRLDYFVHFYTYMAVYEKIKNQSSAQLSLA